VTSSSRFGPLHTLFCAAVLALGLVGAARAQTAAAAFGISSADVYFSEADGSPASLAGSHPDEMTTAFRLNTFIDGEGKERPDGALKDLELNLPPGVVGIPAATPRCTGAEFADIDKNVNPPLPKCSNDSVIGYVKLKASFNPATPGEGDNGAVALYNLQPAPGSAAKFGFVVAAVPVTMEVKLSPTAPYHVIAYVRNTPQPLLFYGASLTLWGDPASATHDTLRGSCLAGSIAEDGSLESRGSCPVSSAAPHKAFLTVPRACLGPLTTAFTADSWEEPSSWAFASSVTHDDESPPNPIGFEGCDELGFEPRISLNASSSAAESSSGLNFSVEMEDEGISDPTQRAQSDVKKIVASLPEGVTLNPSAADGLAACSTQQYEREALTSVPGENCPQASKIGTVSVESPLVDESLEGPLFVAQPDDPNTSTPGAENPFDSFLAVYLVLRNQNLGVIVKQAGRVEADPVTGQLTATFDEVPQVPFSHLETRFREGPRAPLVTPGQCGTYTAKAVQTPWANPGSSIVTTAQFEIASGPGDSGCPSSQAGLAPGFSAGTVTNKAGSFSPFNLRVTRNDGEQELTDLSATLPPGLTGKLAGVDRCPDAVIAAARDKTGREELATPSCPASAQIGQVEVGAGVGPALTYVSGKVFLAGPFEGDPFSAVVLAPGVVGPFDVGNVVVREGLALDPTTTEVTVDGSDADSIPHILKGVPLRLRDLRLSVDRPGFILNPTSCEPSSVRASVAGSGPFLRPSTSVAALAAHFQASDCGDLPFKPKLMLALKGKTKRTGHPALRAQLTARSGDANVGRTAVILPRSLFIDQNHINNPCTRVQFDASACPPTSVLGHARALTPLLDQPLEGPVYFRSNGGARELPDIVADLKGEVHIVLVGFVDAVHRKGSEVSRTRTIFQAVPDAPVSKFVLSLKGGRQGLLQNSTNLCAERQRATVHLKAQNGIKKNFRQAIKTSCRKKR
jgi:hypothetical protein